LEGLASGPAIAARWGRRLDELPADHEAWSIVGGYLGQLAASIALMVSVERIVFGGGVMLNQALFSHVREAARSFLNGYLEPLSDPEALDAYISAPLLGDRAGISGPFLLAELAARR
jgi:fructokinase